MAFFLRRFLCPPVSVGDNAGCAFASLHGYAALPRVLAGRSASRNGAVCRLAVNLRSPRYPRNVSQRSAGIGRAIMMVSAQVGVTRAVRLLLDTAAGRVARAGFGWVVSVGAALRPNPAVERTRRYMASLSEPRWRRAAHLIR